MRRSRKENRCLLQCTLLSLFLSLSISLRQRRTEEQTRRIDAFNTQPGKEHEGEPIPVHFSAPPSRIRVFSPLSVFPSFSCLCLSPSLSLKVLLFLLFLCLSTAKLVLAIRTKTYLPNPGHAGRDKVATSGLDRRRRRGEEASLCPSSPHFSRSFQRGHLFPEDQSCPEYLLLETRNLSEEKEFPEVHSEPRIENDPNGQREEDETRQCLEYCLIARKYGSLRKDRLHDKKAGAGAADLQDVSPTEEVVQSMPRRLRLHPERDGSERHSSFLFLNRFQDGPFSQWWR